MPNTSLPTDRSPVASAGPFDATDPVVLGANPLVGLSRPQVAAALGRLLQRVAVEPGVVTATTLGAASQLLEVVVGRSDVAPEIVPDAGHLLLIEHAGPLAETHRHLPRSPRTNRSSRLVAAARSQEQPPTLGSSS